MDTLNDETPEPASEPTLELRSLMAEYMETNKRLEELDAERQALLARLEDRAETISVRRPKGRDIRFNNAFWRPVRNKEGRWRIRVVPTTDLDQVEATSS
jgi:hypothetical protein